ncbi:MAG: hypothetical protein GY869_15770 [Planctomycetes bacterium]|nr:hypothetical protein [Planctomycetota bacterium]
MLISNRSNNAGCCKFYRVAVGDVVQAVGICDFRLSIWERRINAAQTPPPKGGR